MQCFNHFCYNCSGKYGSATQRQKHFICHRCVFDFVQDNRSAVWQRHLNIYTDTRMPTTCPHTNRCDACSTGWLNGVHPTTADGKVARQVCFNWSSNCCLWNINIEVRNCGSYFVYNLPLTPVCTLRYCDIAILLTRDKMPCWLRDVDHFV